MKNVEKADRLHLGSIVDELKKGHFVIPDFQREFEWEPWDVLELIKSMFMDYYIGTLLLWKGSAENFKLLSCEPIYGYQGGADPQHIVLDGQQRLTAIHYALFGPDKPFPKRANAAAYLVDINLLLEEDYENAFWYEWLSKKYRRLLADKDLQFERHIFPLSVMQGGSWGTSDWIKEYRDYWQNRVEEYDKDPDQATLSREQCQKYVDNAKSFKDLIEELFNQYYISYIELDRDIDVSKVCDIFTQINSRGVRLDIFDLLNAILRPKEIFLKKMWHDSETRLEFTDPKKMKIYILQVMSILEQNYCSSKFLYYLVPEAKKTIKKEDGSKEQIILISDAEAFIAKWSHAVIAIETAIKNLSNPRDFGAINASFVPYPSIIPAFSALKAFVKTSELKNKLDVQSKIRKWYWASIFTKRYSSSVETTSAKDFQDLKRWFLNDRDQPELIEEFYQSYKKLDLIRDHYKGSAIYNAIFNLFVINEARDWATFDLPEYDSLDDHHIVPVSMFREKAGSTINSILNRTPLSSSTNRHIIKNRMPNEYMKEMLDNNDRSKVYDVLASHLISKKAVEILLRDPFEKEDFDEFLQERQVTIIQAIENMLIKEKVDLPPALQELNDRIEVIEVNLRKEIVNTLGDDPGVFRRVVPGTLKDKVQGRIDTALKKNPHMSASEIDSFAKRIAYFDLFEYYDTIIYGQNWPQFEPKFGDKQQLKSRFIQLSVLRNGIRHTREINSTERLDGEAAISWFSQILKN